MLKKLLFIAAISVGGIFLPTDLYAEDGWVINAEGNCPDYTGASAANGTLGILHWKEPFSVRQIVLNNVFELDDETTVNRAVLGINPFDVKMYVDGRQLGSYSDWSQQIDMRNAEHSTSFKAAGKVDVKYSVVALRNLPHSIMFKVKLTAHDSAKIRFDKTISVPAGYQTPRYAHLDFDADGRRMRMQQTNALTAHGRHDVSAASMFICNGFDHKYKAEGEVSSLEFSMNEGEQVEFYIVGSICTTAEYSDPYSESKREIIYIDRIGPESIISGHRRMWDVLWESDIEILGDPESQQAVRFALYSLYSSCREGTRLSVPPMGLSSQGYNGHIFWDTELWMYPPMLMLNQGIARSMIDYRTDRMDAAFKKAADYGYKGLMFPWESDAYGQESTPVWAITGPMEHHVTADVAIAAWNYYCVTKDEKWLRSEGWDLLKGIAEFWVSRVRDNGDGTYSVVGVVGADEYAQNVTDNAFTNAAAKVALANAVKAAQLCGYQAPAEWKAISDGLRFHKSSDGVILEYEGYAGQQIKQADVNLLAHPLDVVTDQEQMLRDLKYYEDKVDPKNGPAMTFSAFCVQYARLGDKDMALKMFKRSYVPNSRPPFGVFAETPTANNPYFTTGAGGMLQAVLCGFGGLKVTDEGIVQENPILPNGWSKLVIKGVGPEKKTYVVTDDEIYSNEKFTWTDSSVIEGSDSAYAPSTEEIVTTCLSKDGKPLKWQKKNDISAYGDYTGASQFETALYNMSVDELINNIEADGTLRTGLLWGGVWTRDVSYSSLLALSYMCPEQVRNSLEVKIDRLGRIIQDTGTGGSWPCSTDRVVWALSAWNVYLATGDLAWLEKAYTVIDKSLSSDFDVAFDRETGLFRGESTFIDWREQSYPVWMQPADIYMSECLGTNAVYHEVLEVAGKMAGILGNKAEQKSYSEKAAALKKAINDNFWLEDEGYYANFLYGRDNLSLSERSETLGASLCVLFGIADQPRASELISSMPVGHFGPPIFSPQIASQGDYHNNAVWPFVTSFWGMAAAKAKNEAAVLHALACNVRTAALYATNYENLSYDTGNPYTTHLNSPNMLWGLSGFMGLFHKTFFGMELSAEGVSFNPFVPAALKGERSLKNFSYRDMKIDISVKGSGDRISSCLVDGKPSSAFLAADLKGHHTVEIVLGGEHAPSSFTHAGYIAAPEYPDVRLTDSKISWNQVKGAAKYVVLKDGKEIDQIKNCEYALNSYGEYQVLAVDENSVASFASEPVRFYAESTTQLIPVDVKLDKKSGEQLSLSFNVDESGWYHLDFEYANGNGEVGQQNNCTTRQLSVDGKIYGAVVFPQRGMNNWTSYGWTNSTRLYLKKGMHVFKLHYLDSNINMNIDKDNSHVKTVRLSRRP